MPKPLAEVYHLDFYGLRKDKYQTLLDNSICTLPWNRIDCRVPAYFFVAKDFGVYGQYQQGFSVNELFPVNSIGIQTHRDDFVVDMDKATLTKRIQTFYDQNYSDREIAAKLNLKDNRDWSIAEARQKETFMPSKILDVLYRPFDYRNIYYSSNLIDFNREKIMQHFLKGDNFGLATCRQQSTFDFQHIFVTKKLVDRNMISLQTKESNYVFPLYLYPETTGQQSLQESSVRQPNLNPAIVQQIVEKLGLPFTPEKSTVIPAGIAGIQNPRMGDLNIPVTGYPHPSGYDVSFDAVQIKETSEPGKQEITPSTFAPIDLLDYIYAVLHSPNYRESYKEFLKTDFPRVPYPDPHTFWPLVKLGGELRQLHLLESPAVNNPITTYPMDGDNTVTRKINQHDFTVRPELVEGRTSAVHPSTTEGSACGASSGRTAEDTPETETYGKVWINDMQYFDSVSKIAWEFYIGGYQPAQKWLKDRHGRTLSFEDILHYQKIIVALTETHRIMQEIDTVY